MAARSPKVLLIPEHKNIPVFRFRPRVSACGGSVAAILAVYPGPAGNTTDGDMECWRDSSAVLAHHSSDVVR
jgi:hypothetical protein